MGTQLQKERGVGLTRNMTVLRSVMSKSVGLTFEIGLLIGHVVLRRTRAANAGTRSHFCPISFNLSGSDVPTVPLYGHF
jgi:hypothetical protein